MTHAQRALILAALGLTPRDGVMPRWSSGNRWKCGPLREWAAMERAGWVAIRGDEDEHYHVTRRGAEPLACCGGVEWRICHDHATTEGRVDRAQG